MKIETTSQGKNEIELKIELTHEELWPFVERACQIISQEIQIPGFRPGKVPFNVLEKRVGAQKIYEEAAHQAIQKTYPEVIKEKKLKTIGLPKVEIIKLAPLNPFVYKARIAVLPSIQLGDYKKIKAKKREVKIEKDKVDKILEDLRKLQAKEIATSEPAQKGDKVEMDFNIYLDKVPIEGGIGKKYPVIIGEGKLVPGFEENLIGLKRGEEKTFKLRFPKDYFQKNLQGKEVEIKVKIHEVYKIKLPQLSDEFARQISRFPTLEELKKQLEQNLLLEAQNKEQQRFELELLDKIIAKTDFGELPSLLIENEVQKMIEEFKEEIESKGGKFEDYLNSIKKSIDDLKQDFEKPAQRRIKAALVLREIAEKENIKVEKKEIDQEIQSILRLYPQNPEIQKQTQTPNFREYIATVLTHRKVFKLLEKFALKD